jgi:hypothetical protein
MISNLLDDSPFIYLDKPVMVTGSGFIPGESINVFIQTTGSAGPSLGFADADKGGAWALMASNLSEKRLIQLAESTLITAPALTLKAEGSHGSSASTPVRVLSFAPVASPAPPPSNANLAAGVAGRVEPGEPAMVWGVGYMPRESVSLIAVDGKGTRTLLSGGVANSTGSISKEVDFDLAVGFYTLEGFGSKGSFAVTPLIVVDK